LRGARAFDPGFREGDDRAIQVSAARRVRRGAAEDRHREAAALPSQGARVSHHILQPEGWARPKGYANGVVARGRTIYLAGQIGWDAQQRFVGTDLVTQARQALRNIVAILAEDGAKPEHIVRMTWYVTDRAAYL